MAGRRKWLGGRDLACGPQFAHHCNKLLQGIWFLFDTSQVCILSMPAVGGSCFVNVQAIPSLQTFFHSHSSTFLNFFCNLVELLLKQTTFFQMSPPIFSYFRFCWSFFNLRVWVTLIFSRMIFRVLSNTSLCLKKHSRFPNHLIPSVFSKLFCRNLPIIGKTISFDVECPGFSCLVFLFWYLWFLCHLPLVLIDLFVF